MIPVACTYLYLSISSKTSDNFWQLMSDGVVIRSASYHDLLSDCQEFRYLVNDHKDTTGVSDLNNMAHHRAKDLPIKETDGIHGNRYIESVKPSPVDQLIKTEERESGDAGLKPYILYLRQKKGFLYAPLSVMSHIIFIAGQISQNSWMAANVQNPDVSALKLISVYIVIGVCTVSLCYQDLYSSLFLGCRLQDPYFPSYLIHCSVHQCPSLILLL